MRARLPAKLGAAVCLLLCAWFLAPLGMGIVHIGMLWPSALLVLAAARLLRPDVFRHLLRKKWLRWTVRAALGLGLAAALGIFGWMVSAAANRAAPAESTVIVLGCQVRGTEPSLTLQRRVDAAADYLRAHPQARCVASGGQSDDEEISEAECIRAALIAAQTGASILPAAIITKNQKVKPFRRSRIVFGQPLTLEELHLDHPDHPDLRFASRLIMEKIGDMIAQYS